MKIANVLVAKTKNIFKKNINRPIANFFKLFAHSATKFNQSFIKKKKMFYTPKKIWWFNILKVSGRECEKNFTDIMKHYRKQPQEKYSRNSPRDRRKIVTAWNGLINLLRTMQCYARFWK